MPQRKVFLFSRILGLIKKFPSLLLPAFFILTVNILVLYLLFLSPQKPVVNIMGPIIAKIWGKQFLHYPFNLYLLPRLYFWASILVNATLGVFSAAWVIVLVKQIKDNNKFPKLRGNLFFIAKKMISLITSWIIIFVLVWAFLKLMNQSSLADNKFYPYLSYFLAMCLQGIFIYVFPCILLDRKNIFVGFIKGVGVFFKNFARTISFVFLLSIIYIPIIYAKNNLISITAKFSPESIVAVIFLGIVVSAIIDFFINIFSAAIYLDLFSDKR